MKKHTSNFYPRTVVCVVWFGGILLLCERLKTRTFKNHWQAAGGKIEKNESIVNAAIREVYEEMGIVLNPQELTLIDCIINDPTTEKCFLFEACLPFPRVANVQNKESKHGPWTPFKLSSAIKLKLCPGLKEYFLKHESPLRRSNKLALS
jgi:8-oxo-dGTP pyrophosphatase MutT (NUDIX family)